MGRMLYIDSDDINGLSEALQEALERRGINFGEFGYPETEDEEEDIDPYLGVMPKWKPIKKTDDDDNWLFQESGGVRYNSGACGYTPTVKLYGGCGGGSCGGGCGYTPSYGGCGGSRC